MSGNMFSGSGDEDADIFGSHYSAYYSYLIRLSCLPAWDVELAVCSGIPSSVGSVVTEMKPGCYCWMFVPGSLSKLIF